MQCDMDPSILIIVVNAMYFVHLSQFIFVTLHIGIPWMKQKEYCYLKGTAISEDTHRRDQPQSPRDKCELWGSQN